MGQGLQGEELGQRRFIPLRLGWQTGLFRLWLVVQTVEVLNIVWLSYSTTMCCDEFGAIPAASQYS